MHYIYALLLHVAITEYKQAYARHWILHYVITMEHQSEWLADVIR